MDVWTIPLLPLLAAAAGSVMPRSWRRLSAFTAIAAISVSFVLACRSLFLALEQPVPVVLNFAWFDLGNSALRIGWILDPLGAFMAVMVTLVSLLIFIFSLGYMRQDPNFSRFFCFLSLFASAMLGLLMANSLLLLFVCWEIVGLASYLLIGFWFQRPAAAAAAKKAFLTTRIGDIGLFIGMLWLANSSGTLLFYDGGSGCLEPSVLARLALPTLAGGWAISTAVSLLIFCGAIGKSGQFPLHVWLPDAMEGPSPVSALIHAATMVAAGVFLVARIYPLMTADQAMQVPIHALTVVAGVGALTALLGALIASAQTDIKRILAYSTVSQLGYMMLAAGVGSWVAALFHLLAHAFFKALLFLGAGSVIHGVHHEQDIRRLGGLGQRMKTTCLTFAIGMMALSGVPFLFSGFWSKEGILHAAAGWPVSHGPIIAGLIAVFLTAFYMTRLMGEVFFGKGRSDEALRAHESPSVMTVPLCILAFFALTFGFLGTPAWPWIQSRLTGQPLIPEAILEGWRLMGCSSALVGAGIGAGWLLYVRRPRLSPAAADPMSDRFPTLFRFLADRMRFDELYSATVGEANLFLSELADALDRWVWSGLVFLAGRLGELLGVAGRRTDEGGLNRGFDSAGAGLRAAGSLYSRAQTGQPQGYLRCLAVAFVVLACLLLGGWWP